jgi:serine/threonine protein kinase
MALTSGTKLGPYEIQSPLGAAGMGEVYRARDTRLDRMVAIKVITELKRLDVKARKRLLKEARSASKNRALPPLGGVRKSAKVRMKTISARRRKQIARNAAKGTMGQKEA